MHLEKRVRQVLPAQDCVAQAAALGKELLGAPEVVGLGGFAPGAEGGLGEELAAMPRWVGSGGEVLGCL